MLATYVVGQKQLTIQHSTQTMSWAYILQLSSLHHNCKNIKSKSAVAGESVSLCVKHVDKSIPVAIADPSSHACHSKASWRRKGMH